MCTKIAFPWPSQIMNIGRTVRILRNAKGLSANDVARRSSISPAMLTMIERGDREPSIKVLRQIAKTLNIPSEVLLVAAQSDEGGLALTDAGHQKMTSAICKAMEAEEKLKRLLQQRGDREIAPGRLDD